MKKFFSAGILFALLLTGCYQTSSLDRTPPKKTHRQTTTVKPVKKSKPDSLFDKIFHRNPQSSNATSLLSEREQELLRRNDVHRNPDAEALHSRGERSRQSNSDWVFGTENGSFFKKTD
jgi:hypothetical protein